MRARRPSTRRCTNGDTPAKALVSPVCTTGWWDTIPEDTSGQKYNLLSSRGYAYRNCTDYVAWKLQSANGFAAISGWGYGYQWGGRATAAHYTVDMVPAPGAVAWYNSGAFGMSSYGHVAYMESVNADGTVNLSEYNNPADGNYHTRTIVASQVSGYIHFKDLSSTLPVRHAARGPRLRPRPLPRRHHRLAHQPTRRINGRDH
jgi:surface antigen